MFSKIFSRIIWLRLTSLGLATILTLSGCATRSVQIAGQRKFHFQTDTFAFANEVVWVYDVDPKTGKQIHHRRDYRPDYVLHCFVVARSAKQFFQFATFDPAQPKLDAESYRSLVREVIGQNPRHGLPEEKKIVFPGYKDLREFSSDYAGLLKAECGGVWQSYFQRGNWRMVLPVSRRHQQRTAEGLAASLQGNNACVVHIFCFPALTINHAILLFDATESEKKIHFAVYDPNIPEKPLELIYDKAARQFSFPATFYFKGGAVDVYEIYCGKLY